MIHFWFFLTCWGIVIQYCSYVDLFDVLQRSMIRDRRWHMSIILSSHPPSYDVDPLPSSTGSLCFDWSIPSKGKEEVVLPRSSRPNVHITSTGEEEGPLSSLRSLKREGGRLFYSLFNAGSMMMISGLECSEIVLIFSRVHRMSSLWLRVILVLSLFQAVQSSDTNVWSLLSSCQHTDSDYLLYVQWSSSSSTVLTLGRSPWRRLHPRDQRYPLQINTTETISATDISSLAQCNVFSNLIIEYILSEFLWWYDRHPLEFNSCILNSFHPLCATNFTLYTTS